VSAEGTAEYWREQEDAEKTFMGINRFYGGEGSMGRIGAFDGSEGKLLLCLTLYSVFLNPSFPPSS
jgi:hypothetical protein